MFVFALRGPTQVAICRILATASQTLPGMCGALRTAADGDAAAMAAMAHTIKGMAGSLKAQSVSQMAARAEEAARRGSADAAVLARELADAVEGLVAELAASGMPAEGPVVQDTA